MVSLLFFLSVAGLFGLIFAVEAEASDARPKLGQIGLVRWLASGNWPAKVGAGLLIIGVGALLRYALVNIDVPNELKLGSGLLICGVLAAGSFALRDKRGRHAIHLALAGAAAGVAYLTAYSAYGFFHYVNQVNTLAMLALVAIATGSFAVSARSMSIAILAMVGAYLAPAFALENAGPGAVYGYYLGISLLCLLMVALRGWRGLIHLSFLFTLAGALFFYWTREFAQPKYYDVMQPLLLALAAVHLAMPLVERRHLPAKWMSRFDTGYFILLPLSAAALTILIAPDVQRQGALGLAMLGGVWGAAGVVLKLLKRDEALSHGVMAVLLLGAALLFRLDDVPWLLAGLGAAVAAMAVAPRMGWQKSTQDFLAGVVVLLGLMHALSTLTGGVALVPFDNAIFGKRLVAAAMLGVAAFIARRRELAMARTLALVAIAWLGLSLADELRRMYIEYIPQFVYGLLLAALAVAAAMQRWLPLRSVTIALLVAALLAAGPWAASHAGPGFALGCLLATPGVLLGLAFLRSRSDEDDGAATLIIAVLPLAVLAFVGKAIDFGAANPAFPLLDAAVVGAGLSLAATVLWQPRNEYLKGPILSVHFVLAALFLFGAAALYVERSGPAVFFDCAALAYLGAFAASRDAHGRHRPTATGTLAVIAAGVVLQSMLLRLLGPPGPMTIADIVHMQFPAVVSLTWVVLGAGLAWWGTRRLSRSLWVMGAGLLVAAAVKLVLIDFGSLGQLSNILAMIAAGLVFLGVAWLAPMPPKPEAPEPPPAPPMPPRGGPPPRAPEPSPPGMPPRASAMPPPLPAGTRPAEAKFTGRAVFALPPDPPQPAVSSAAPAPAAVPEAAPAASATAAEAVAEPDPRGSTATASAQGAPRAAVAAASSPHTTIHVHGGGKTVEPTRRVKTLSAVLGLLVAFLLVAIGMHKLNIERARTRFAEEQARVALEQMRRDEELRHEQEQLEASFAAERAEREAEMLRQGSAPSLLASGGHLPIVPPGEAGLAHAMARGLLRRATNTPDDEAMMRQARVASSRDPAQVPQFPQNVYIVLGPFMLPRSTFEHPQILIVPASVQSPSVDSYSNVAVIRL